MQLSLQNVKKIGKMTRWPVYQNFSRSLMIPASEKYGKKKFGFKLLLPRF